MAADRHEIGLKSWPGMTVASHATILTSLTRLILLKAVVDGGERENHNARSRMKKPATPHARQRISGHAHR